MTSDRSGKNSLLDATLSRNIWQIRVLMKSGVNPCKPTIDGTSPLHRASVIEGPIGSTIVSIMLSHGANPNAISKNGLTPLHIAAMWGRASTIDVLLNNGSDVTLKDHDDMSALDYAELSDHCRDECIDALTRYRLVEKKSHFLKVVKDHNNNRKSNADNDSSSESFWSVSSVPVFSNYILPKTFTPVSKQEAKAIVNRANVISIMCSLQETFRWKVDGFEHLCDVAQKLQSSMLSLGVPAFIIEDPIYERGPTIRELDVSGMRRLRKTSFSAVNKNLLKILKDLKKKSKITGVILFGLETHVSIQHTALDLLLEGYDVFVASDATSSRSLDDHMFALERIRQSGGFIYSSNTIISMMLQDQVNLRFNMVNNS